MLTEPGFSKDFAKVPLYCDNTATLHALGNRPFSSRTKHIALRFFFVRELVSKGRASIHYIPTDINPADIGTYHLNKHRFRNLLDIISNFNVNDFINSNSSSTASSISRVICLRVCFESVLFVRINLLFLQSTFGLAPSLVERAIEDWKSW